MPGVFRFSNAVSDISKFIETYKSLYRYFCSRTNDAGYFDHDDAAQFLARQGLASSLGAIGEEALRRSIRPDKSRDPLYNQHKSYSEMFRMLGWYEPGSKQTNFKLTEFGNYIYEATGDNLSRLFELNALHIVSPNPLTTIKGNNVLRPFPLLLKLIEKSDGIICRDEIILSVLACENDRDENVVDKQVNYIKEIRKGGKNALSAEMDRLKAINKINSPETLPNYTRFPISALKWCGWATSVSLSNVYGEQKQVMLRISEKGVRLVAELNHAIDVRYEDIQPFTQQEQAAFIVWSNMYQLIRLGGVFPDSQRIMSILKNMASPIFRDLHLNEHQLILFFGYQEAPRILLTYGDEILDSL